MEINYDALDAMVTRLEDGGTFSLDEVREVFGTVVDDAIASEQTSRTDAEASVSLMV